MMLPLTVSPPVMSSCLSIVTFSLNLENTVNCSLSLTGGVADGFAALYSMPVTLPDSRRFSVVMLTSSVPLRISMSLPVLPSLVVVAERYMRPSVSDVTPIVLVRPMYTEGVSSPLELISAAAVTDVSSAVLLVFV